MDASKHISQLYGVNATEAPVLRRKAGSCGKEIMAFFEKLAATTIAIEAGGASITGRGCFNRWDIR
jgi:transposase